MRPRLVLAALAALALICASSSSRPLGAQSTPPPDTEFVPAVWLATSAGLVKAAQADGTLLLEIGEPAGVRAVAVDAARSLVWAYAPGALTGYTLGGVETRLIPTPVPGDYTDSTPVALTVNAATGAVWLSVGPSLQQFDTVGTRLTAQCLVEAPRVLDYDPRTRRLWVGTASQVVALDDAGVQVASLDLDHDTVHDLAVDPTNGDLWVALNNTLRRYDAATSAVEADTRIPSLKWVAGDGTGGAWQTTPQDLYRLDALGATLRALDPWPEPGPLVTVAADPWDASAWVASHTGLSRVPTAGQIAPTVTLPSPHQIRRLALYADRAPPTITIVQPTDGSFVNTVTPTIEVMWTDDASGVDRDSLTLAAHGVAIAANCVATATGAACVPAAPFTDGPVALTAAVSDRAGHGANSMPVAVTVDTAAPTVLITNPANATFTNQPQQVVEGEVTESSTLTIRVNGATTETLVIAAAGSFSAVPIALAEGLNRIEVFALDLAGNQGRAETTVTLDTQAPGPVVSGGWRLQTAPSGLRNRLVRRSGRCPSRSASAPWSWTTCGCPSGPMRRGPSSAPVSWVTRSPRCPSPCLLATRPRPRCDSRSIQATADHTWQWARNSRSSN